MAGEGRIMLPHYRIAEKLGEGGMGVVWRAVDTRLGREVAIKVLPADLARDPDRIGRFEREARVLASLNHPNVAAIFGIEHQVTEEGVAPVLVLEYVPGVTLAELIKRGPLPLDDALDAALQIAEGLEAAHESGIIHRDLKPANVKRTPDGRVKVLDFGLAKALAPEAFDALLDGVPGDTAANSPTVSTSRTRLGAIIGTAAYMSPEQARGKPVDKRTDIWSFGCLLYECLTGMRPFPGETSTDIIGAILHLEPDWTALPPATPPRVADLLRRCLEKDAKRRLRDIGDARLELAEAAAGRISAPGSLPRPRTHHPGVSGDAASAGSGATAATADTTRSRPKGIAIALGVILGAILGAALWAAFGPHGGGAGSSAGAPVQRLSVNIPDDLEVLDYIDITRDGQSIVARGRTKSKEGKGLGETRLYVRRMDSFEFEPVKGTEGAFGALNSPDGKWLAFIATAAPGTTQKRLMKVLLDRGALPMAVADWDDDWQGVVWLEDGDFLTMSTREAALVRLSAADGKAQPTVKLDAGAFQGSFFLVCSLPFDRGILARTASYGSRGSELGIGLIDPVTGKARVLVANGGSPAFLAPGQILFSRSDTLLAAPFDLDSLEITGGPVPVLGGLRTVSAWLPGSFGISLDGTLGYVPGGIVGAKRRMVVADRSGQVEPWSDERRSFEASPAISLDGRRVATVIANLNANFEIWASERNRRVFRRSVAIPDADCFSPAWSPEGDRLAFCRRGKDAQNDGIYIVRADTGEAPTRIFRADGSPDLCTPSQWTPDGSAILGVRRISGNWDIVLVPAQTRGQPTTARPVLATGFSEFDPAISPDGRWLAYASDESGRTEVYVAPFRPDRPVGPAAQVSRDGGWWPRWSLDGHTLYIATLDNQVMTASVSTEPDLVLGTPSPLMDLSRLRAARTSGRPEFGVLPDGRIILIQKGDEEDEIHRFEVVRNWSSELAKKLSAAR